MFKNEEYSSFLNIFLIVACSQALTKNACALVKFFLHRFLGCLCWNSQNASSNLNKIMTSLLTSSAVNSLIFLTRQMENFDRNDCPK